MTFVLLVAAALLAASAAEAASVKEIFEKHNLLGTFAFNCARPMGRDNRYFVHRALPSGQVQREMMSGPATRDFLVIWERGSDLGADRIALSGARDGEPAESVYRVEPGRARVLESTVAGRKEIAGGRFTGGGDTRWMYRCDAPGQASLGKPPAAEPMDIIVNGQARRFLLVRPSGQAPSPTVIMLHGLNGTGADIARRTALDQLGPRAGFAAVFPDGCATGGTTSCPARSRLSLRTARRSAASPTTSVSSSCSLPISSAAASPIQGAFISRAPRTAPL